MAAAVATSSLDRPADLIAPLVIPLASAIVSSMSIEERLDHWLSNRLSLTDVSIKGLSPLHYACSMFDEDLALRILREGVDVDWAEVGRDGYTALHLACEAGMRPVAAEWLARAKAAESAGGLPVRYWLSRVTCDIRVTSSTFQAGGRTPLHIAAYRGPRPLIARSPICSAELCAGEDELVTLLLAAGSDPRLCDWDDNPPLVMAAFANRPSTAALLRKAMIALVPDTRDATSHGLPLLPSTADALAAAAISSKHVVWPWGDSDLPSREWLNNKLRADQDRARLRSDKLSNPSGALTEFHVLPSVWSAAECRAVLQSVLRTVSVNGWSTNRHRAYNTTDIQAADVPEVEPFVRHSIRTRVFPQMLARYFGSPGSTAVSSLKLATDAKTDVAGYAQPATPDRDRCDGAVASSSYLPVQLGFRDLFFVKYEAATGEQSSLDLHRDGSLLSFNLLLNSPTDFTGGGTYFADADRTITIGQGDVLCHSGQLLHGGNAVTRGSRFILVGFIDVIGYHPAASDSPLS